MPKKVPLTTLGKYLRNVRTNENMTIKEMSEYLGKGYSPQMLYKIETGERNPPQDFIWKYETYVRHHLHLTTYDEEAKNDLKEAWLLAVDKVEVQGYDKKRIAYALKDATDDQLKRIQAILDENTFEYC